MFSRENWSWMKDLWCSASCLSWAQKERFDVKGDWGFVNFNRRMRHLSFSHFNIQLLSTSTLCWLSFENLVCCFRISLKCVELSFFLSLFWLIVTLHLLSYALKAFIFISIEFQFQKVNSFSCIHLHKKKSYNKESSSCSLFVSHFHFWDQLNKRSLTSHKRC